MTAPDRRDDVSGPALEGLLDMVATMRALRYVAPALEAQALTEALASERLVFITQDGQKHTLLVGGEAPDSVGDAPDRFARFADEDGVVFVLQGALLHNLTLKAAEFNPASQPLPTQ